MSGKRAVGSSNVAGNEAPSSSKQRKSDPGNWCVDCWSGPKSTCRGVHRLLDREAAEKEEQAKIKTAKADIAAANQVVARKEAVLKRLQKRLNALAEARAQQGPVLKATVEENCDDSWFIEGGDIRIAIAASLTRKEKKAICQELEGLNVDYEVDDDDDDTKRKYRGDDAVTAYGTVDVTALQSVMMKLPDCVAGQSVQRGAVLISAKGRLEVFFQEQPSRSVKGFKMFGQVKSEGDLRALEGAGCPAGVCEDERYGRGYSDCFCQTGKTESTTLNDVEFLE